MRSRLKRSRVHVVLFFCSVLLRWFPVFNSAAVVSFDSIEPSVYFKCEGENKTDLPDVKKKHVLYTFKGEESWQPLTDITDKKCKRCGFYEHDILKSDSVFDEWEFCASDFMSSDASEHTSASHSGKKRKHWILVILISALVSVVLVFGAVIAYKYWQKRKR